MKTAYTSPYANNLDKMHNSEKTALAKNRFTDAETQIAIAKDWYKLAQSYLAQNPNITDEAAQELWTKRGYVLKAALLSRGRVKLKENEYGEVYRKYFKNNSRSHWRMMSAFLGGYWYRRPTGESRTPGALLEEIWADLPESEQRTHTIERFVEHPNCTLNLALRISTMKTPESQHRYYGDSYKQLRQAALLKVAEITKFQELASR